MRKHRLFGVVIACLIAVGVFTHASDTSHSSPGTERAGMQLTAAELPADRVGTGDHPTVATDTSAPTHKALLDLVAGHAVTILSSPFGTQALVADFDIALLNRRAELSAYFVAMAERKAVAKSYLESVAPRPAPAAPPAPPAVRTPVAAPGDPWPALRECESGGSYGENTGNGYYGAYQFNLGTWRSLGLGGLPSQASPAQQDQAAQELQARRGWGQWPACARRLGLT